MPGVGQPAVQWEPLTAQWFSAVSNIIQHPLLIYRIFKLTWLITFTAYIHRVFVCLRLCVCLHVCGVHLLCLFRLRLRQVLHTHRGSVCNQCPPRQPDHASEYSSLLRQKKNKKTTKTQKHTRTPRNIHHAHSQSLWAVWHSGFRALNSRFWPPASRFLINVQEKKCNCPHKYSSFKKNRSNQKPSVCIINVVLSFFPFFFFFKNVQI